MRRWLVLAFLVGCKSSGTIGIGDDTDTEGTDPGTDPEPEPAWDLAHFSAELAYTYDTWGTDWDCTDEAAMTGEPIADGRVEAQLAETCPACDWFYKTSYDRPSICNNRVQLVDGYRGLYLGDGFAFVYWFRLTDQGVDKQLEDDAADFNGTDTVTWTASRDLYGAPLVTDGTLVFPQIQQ